MAKAGKLLLFGIDGGMFYFVKRFASEGLMPNVAQLIERGAFARAMPDTPCDTPTNWTTIVTGAHPNVHGVTGFYTFLPRQPLIKGHVERTRSMASDICQAEYLWDIADENGKKPLVIHYPVGWPARMKNGMMIRMGMGVIAREERYVLGAHGEGTPITLERAEDWENPPESCSPLLEATLPIRGSYSPSGTWRRLEWKANVHALLVDTKGKAYDKVIFTDDKKGGERVVVGLNETTRWLRVKARSSAQRLENEERSVEAILRYTVEALESDSSVEPPRVTRIVIRRSTAVGAEDWAHPTEIIHELVDIFDQPVFPGSIKEFAQGVGIELHEPVDEITAVIDRLAEKERWDVLVLHFHIMDGINHEYLGYLVKDSLIYDPKKYEEAFNTYRHSYQVVDEFIGRILKRHCDEETATVVVSDHAAVPNWLGTDLYRFFVKNGLLTYKWDAEKQCYVIDWTKTKAFPLTEPNYVWVNLKDRHPHGIVEPGEEYERTREQIIKTLYAIMDPFSGSPIVQLAIRREEMDMFGGWSERIGDVVYFLRPGYVLDTMFIHELSPQDLSKPDFSETSWKGYHTLYLPSARVGDLTNDSFFIMSSPGVKRGIELNQPIHLVDVAPTIACLLGLPKPAQSTGRVLEEILESSSP